MTVMVVELTHEADEAGTEGLPEETGYSGTLDEASGTLDEGVATGYSGTLEVSPAGLLEEATGYEAGYSGTLEETEMGV